MALASELEIVLRRAIEVDDAFRIARADRDLVHVHVGRMQQAALGRDREHRQRIGHGLGADRRALERIDGDVDTRALAGAHLLADVEHRRLVHLALADHHAAANGQLGQLPPHGIDGGLVGALDVTATAQSRGGDGGGLRHARESRSTGPGPDVACALC